LAKNKTVTVWTAESVVKEFGGSTVTSATLAARFRMDSKILRRHLRKYFAAERAAEVAAGNDRPRHKYDFKIDGSETGLIMADTLAGILNYMQNRPASGSATVPVKAS